MVEQLWFDLAFYIIAGLLIVSAFAVVTLPRIVHSALVLIFFFLNVAALYVLLNAEFIAAVQVIIYVGAVAVLFLFAIMLTSRSYLPDSNPTNRQWAIAGFTSAALLFVFLVVLTGAQWQAGGEAPQYTTELLGRLLLNEFLIPFEIVALLLLIAMIGAIVIAKER